MDSLAHPSSGSFDSQISFIKHGDLAQPVTIKVASFQGRLPQRPLTDLLDHPHLKHHGFQQALPSDLYVKIELWADNKPLIPSVQTAHKAFKSREQVDWNEHITLPIKYRDLPLNAQLVVTVYDIAGPGQLAVVGGSTLRLFGGKCTLRKGKQRLYLWKGVAADPHDASETPSKVGLKDEMGRLEKLVKRHERGDIARLDWLDKLAFRQIEKIHKASSVSSVTLNSRNGTDKDIYRLNRKSLKTSSCISTYLGSTFPSSSANRSISSPLSLIDSRVHPDHTARRSIPCRSCPLRACTRPPSPPPPRPPPPKGRLPPLPLARRTLRQKLHSSLSSIRRSCARIPSRRNIVDWSVITGTDRWTAS